MREKARRLLSDEPWAASAWDRLAEGIVFGGLESWLPWLAPERTVLAEAAPGTRVALFDPVRSQNRAQELVKEETEMAATLAEQGTARGGTHGTASFFVTDVPDRFVDLFRPGEADDHDIDTAEPQDEADRSGPFGLGLETPFAVDLHADHAFARVV